MWHVQSGNVISLKTGNPNPPSVWGIPGSVRSIRLSSARPLRGGSWMWIHLHDIVACLGCVASASLSTDGFARHDLVEHSAQEKVCLSPVWRTCCIPHESARDDYGILFDVFPLRFVSLLWFFDRRVVTSNSCISFIFLFGLATTYYLFFSGGCRQFKCV